LNTIVLIAFCLGVSLLFSEIFRKAKYPRVIGQIIAGIILGFPFVKLLFTTQNISDIGFLSELGIVFLLLLVGLEINIPKLRRSSKDALLIAVSSAIIPFILGFGLMRWLGYSNLVAAVLGSSLALTAEGSKLAVLIETKVLNTRVGSIMLGAGILDDIFEVIFLALLLAYLKRTHFYLQLVPITLIGIIIVIYLSLKLVPKLFKAMEDEKSKISILSTVIVIGFGAAAISHIIGFGPVIGAFLGGLFIQRMNKGRKLERLGIDRLKVLTFALIIPFFFINIGMHFNFESIISHPSLLLYVLAVAVAGKMIGTIIVTPLTTLNLKQTTLIGWGMNSRGAIELIIAEIARVNNIIPIEIYSAIVVMAVVTTLMFPFALKYYLRRYPGIMDERA
jgi:Kef-type K+ transport system membrane component KefB